MQLPTHSVEIIGGAVPSEARAVRKETTFFHKFAIPSESARTSVESIGEKRARLVAEEKARFAALPKGLQKAIKDEDARRRIQGHKDYYANKPQPMPYRTLPIVDQVAARRASLKTPSPVVPSVGESQQVVAGGFKKFLLPAAAIAGAYFMFKG